MSKQPPPGPFVSIVSTDGRSTDVMIQYLQGIDVLRPYTLATLPPAQLGLQIIVTDASGGPAPCYGDGTDFRRLSNDAVVS